MELNATKCKTMHISRKRAPTPTQYSINENILEQVSTIKDLGVLISNNLISWSKHMDNIVSKANKTLGLVKRICKEVKNTNTRRILYCALVSPKLEYASSVWSPTINNRLPIENVQRRATKLILNYPDNKRNFWSDIAVQIKTPPHNNGYERTFMHLQPRLSISQRWWK
jgi:hypothetical protein